MRALARLGARRALLGAGAVALVAVILITVLATRSAQPGTVTASPLLGRSAPAIVGRDVVSGRTVRLSALRGRYVIVNFFASWCTPCTVEAPQMVAYLYAHRRSPVSVLGVVFDDSAASARAFLGRMGASWPAVNDPQGSLAVAYGVSDPPESFVVAPNGRVVARVIGGLTEAGLDQLIGTGAVNS